ncbi:hypothetical protein BD410DRAFT_121938 [Rickenella mellea]|uniref:Uncharacterized protein n=1 Tax=Rickenella mellea TaxID=50990 RepID=A0A4Y7PIQ3_9AGAM|nr:hypothetical protein BD410DRAFT_121938 [Rickenella mellea]
MFSYPESSRLAIISVTLNWNAFDDPHNPACQWRIDTPESLYYPGTHRGDLSFAKFGSNVLDARIKVQWSSAILSPFVTESGHLSSDGYLEDSMIMLAFTPTLMALAHIFHEVSGAGFRYITQGKDRFTRAASFFSRAYTSRVPEEDDFTAVGFSHQCRQTSITVIQELLEFHNASLLQESTVVNSEWDFCLAFADVNSQREWAMEERRWADKITAVLFPQCREAQLNCEINELNPPAYRTSSIVRS